MLNNAKVRSKMTQSLDPHNYELDSISPKHQKYGIIKTGESMQEYNRLIVQQMYAQEFEKGSASVRTNQVPKSI